MTSKKILTCDEVFEVLTSCVHSHQSNSNGAASNSGASIDSTTVLSSRAKAVERHLLTCEECHRFSEELRPAIDVLQGSLQSGSLVARFRYRGYADAPWLQAAAVTNEKCQTMGRETGPNRRPAVAGLGDGSFGLFAGWVAVAMLGLLFFGCFEVIQQNQRDRVSEENSTVSQLTVIENGKPTKAGRDLLASLRIPDDCYSDGESEQVVFSAKISRDVQLLCCKECHTQALERAHFSDAGKMVGTCSLCHLPDALKSYYAAFVIQ